MMRVDVPDAFRLHLIDDADCAACFSTPARRCVCGGVIHSEYLDEGYDNLIVAFWCDRCGSTDEE